jgi:hypothetical protein
MKLKEDWEKLKKTERNWRRLRETEEDWGGGGEDWEKLGKTEGEVKKTEWEWRILEFCSNSLSLLQFSSGSLQVPSVVFDIIQSSAVSSSLHQSPPSLFQFSSFSFSSPVSFNFLQPPSISCSLVQISLVFFSLLQRTSGPSWSSPGFLLSPSVSFSFLQVLSVSFRFFSIFQFLQFSSVSFGFYSILQFLSVSFSFVQFLQFPSASLEFSCILRFYSSFLQFYEECRENLEETEKNWRKLKGTKRGQMKLKETERNWTKL